MTNDKTRPQCFFDLICFLYYGMEKMCKNGLLIRLLIEQTKRRYQQ